ncbi:uncharacterized protein LOC110237809 [Exaiptasia diaphana]|uniref:Uncharacterized protein n=1 Tax=Exaiptasia diaphana TaxID=2652724 RepID=A0A913X536_EXADI|nr:uncharacterized protein LOC110237809 [Exaiptasia diaphana]XP_020899079.1 uncharacterized protein LOC110237809 [Exaiptasia diaphana]KXJ15164.1 hypothetical protein AC249_AIPGENE2835 [Exaiptasia diaphana]
MSTFQDFINLGKKYGLDGRELLVFAKEQQAAERQERAEARALEKAKLEAQEKANENAKEIELARIAAEQEAARIRYELEKAKLEWKAEKESIRKGNPHELTPENLTAANMSQTEYEDIDIENMVDMVNQISSSKEPSEKQYEKLYQDIKKFFKENPNVKEAIKAYFSHILPLILSMCPNEYDKQKVFEILLCLFNNVKRRFLKRAFNALPKCSFPAKELSKGTAGKFAAKAGLRAAGVSALMECFLLYTEYNENKELLKSGKISGEESRKMLNGSIGKSVLTVAGNGVAGYAAAAAAAVASGPVGWALVGAVMFEGCVFSYMCGIVGRDIGEKL